VQNTYLLSTTKQLSQDVRSRKGDIQNQLQKKLTIFLYNL